MKTKEQLKIYNRNKQAERRFLLKEKGLKLNNPIIAKKADLKFQKKHNSGIIQVRSKKEAITDFKKIADDIGISYGEFFELLVSDFKSKV